MKIALVNTWTKATQHWAARAEHWFKDQLVWLTATRTDLDGKPNSSFAWCVVVGREHYTEWRKSYPVRNWLDLYRVVTLELADQPGTMAHIGSLQGDERTVTYFKFREVIDSEETAGFFLIPETLLLASVLPAGSIATFERSGFRYFLAANGVSQIAGGTLVSAELFALATGIHVSDDIEIWDESRTRQGIFEGVKRLPITAWWGLRSRARVAMTTRFAMPVMSTLAVVFAGYLVLASAYLSAIESWRVRSVDRLGSEVTGLIAQQRAVDMLAAELNGIAQITDTHRAAWPLWSLLPVVWGQGGGVISVNLRDDRVILRGSAPVATDVLAALSALSEYQDVRFDNAVRPGGLGEEFLISMSRKPVVRDADPTGVKP